MTYNPEIIKILASAHAEYNRPIPAGQVAAKFSFFLSSIFQSETLSDKEFRRVMFEMGSKFLKETYSDLLALKYDGAPEDVKCIQEAFRVYEAWLDKWVNASGLDAVGAEDNIIMGALISDRMDYYIPSGEENRRYWYCMRSLRDLLRLSVAASRSGWHDSHWGAAQDAFYCFTGHRGQNEEGWMAAYITDFILDYYKVDKEAFRLLYCK